MPWYYPDDDIGPPLPQMGSWMPPRISSVWAIPGYTALTQADRDVSGDVTTAEACFRLPDGWSICVLRYGLEYVKYQERGYPEILQGSPEFIPPVTPEVTRHDPPPVVSSDPQAGVSEDAVSDSWWHTAIEIGSEVYGNLNQAGQTPIFNYDAGGGTQTPMMQPTGPMSACSGCSSNPCVCGTINGRPALVDPRTGKRCYRRRRRVMLTEGDFNTLLRIATLPNNANVRTALAKAIGRR